MPFSTISSTATPEHTSLVLPQPPPCPPSSTPEKPTREGLEETETCLNLGKAGASADKQSGVFRVFPKSAVPPIGSGTSSRTTNGETEGNRAMGVLRPHANGSYKPPAEISLSDNSNIEVGSQQKQRSQSGNELAGNRRPSVQGPTEISRERSVERFAELGKERSADTSSARSLLGDSTQQQRSSVGNIYSEVPRYLRRREGTKVIGSAIHLELQQTKEAWRGTEGELARSQEERDELWNVLTTVSVSSSL